MMSIFSILIAAAANFHEIASPVDYSLIPTWAVFVATFFALAIIGLIVWLIRRSRQHAPPAKSAREPAVQQLARNAEEIKGYNVQQFSFRHSRFRCPAICVVSKARRRR